MYSHAWDRVDGALVMMPASVKRFEDAHAKASAALAAAKPDEERFATLDSIPRFKWFQTGMFAKPSGEFVQMRDVMRWLLDNAPFAAQPLPESKPEESVLKKTLAAIDAEDAARYRWLRHGDLWHRTVRVMETDKKTGDRTILCDKYLDAAVDEAMASSPATSNTEGA